VPEVAAGVGLGVGPVVLDEPVERVGVTVAGVAHVQ
jgi:hypothetical protein